MKKKNFIRKNIRTISTTLKVVVVLVSLVILGWSINEYAIKGTKTAMSPEFKQGFIEGCTENGGSISFCECGLAYLEEHYSAEEIIVFGMDPESSKYSDMVNNSVANCISKF